MIDYEEVFYMYSVLTLGMPYCPVLSILSLTISMGCLTVLFCLSSFFLVFRVSTTVDNIAANTSIADGETLVSPGGYYELGFFDPGNSKRYIGIWYKKIVNGTIVWVANGDSPLNDSSGILQLSEQGNLVISSDSGFQVWSSNTSKQGAKNLQARLLDTGNFIIKDGEETLWQSFDHIGNTLLPEMKLGRNLVTGLDWYLTSWKNENDPVTGEYTVRLDVNGYPQFFLRKGSMVQGRWGPWNGLTFSGTTHLKPNSIYNYNFVYNEEEIYYHFELESLVITRLLLDPVGVQQGQIWIDRKAEWNVYVTVQLDPCDQYALCGPYGSCNIDNSPRCGCLRGFQPMSPTEWDSGDWSKGCIRKIALTCKNGEGFLHVSSIKLPDTSKSWYDRKMSLNACQEMCTKNCSCIAYANQDIRYGSGCLLWFDELTDIREYTDNGQDLYIRMSASELGGGENVAVVRIKRSSVEKVVVRVVTPVLIGIVILGLICVLRERKRRRLKLEVPELHIQEIYANDDDDGSQKDLELPLFDFDVVADATNEFSNKNKIGEGGFGSVYKGILKDGQEIAVKRLSKDSRQGVSEFKNEVALIAKLQHRNLVKLLGCCIQEEEKILIYEYMPNKSLDSFIFSLSPSIAMDWTLRCHIINGIARGLLYLHQDSRLRIIHRDLKPSNVLLDKEMNPKISDFGIAKGFGGAETEANTLRVVGTYGYMSPEYIIDGAFSVKSDVFSFGVLLLEIISGRSNRRFIHPGHKLNLLGHAWKLFQEGRSNELIDASIAETCNECQVLRYIQVGLLCVQQNPEPRPTMASVMLMLSSDMALPLPKEPGFFAERQLVAEGGSSSSVIELISMNQMTITALEAR